MLKGERKRNKSRDVHESGAENGKEADLLLEPSEENTVPPLPSFLSSETQLDFSPPDNKSALVKS